MGFFFPECVSRVLGLLLIYSAVSHIPSTGYVSVLRSRRAPSAFFELTRFPARVPPEPLGRTLWRHLWSAGARDSPG